MGNVHVIFQLDTEDFINEISDDILIELVNIFDKHNVKVTFAIVGEKARVLDKRNRKDVIEALKRHDIAYQSNLHSVHPVITEYVKNLDWYNGVEEVVKREVDGIIDIMKIFGKRPKAFVQPGGSWAPQTVYAMRKMGINVYADGIFESRPFWYCGVLGVRYTIRFKEDIAHLDDYLRKIKKEFKARYLELKDKGGVIIVLFHPCKLVTKEFWDSLNFAKGINKDKITCSTLYPKEEVRAKLRNLNEFLNFIKGHNVKFTTLSELYDLFEKPLKTNVTISEVKCIAKHFTERLSYFKLSRQYISPAEGFYILSSFLSYYYLNNKCPEIVKCMEVLGPIQKPKTVKDRIFLTLLEFLRVVSKVKLYLNTMRVIPHEIRVGTWKIGPGDFMKAMASVSLKLINGKKIERVTIEPFRQIPELDFDLSERVKRSWKWIIFPEEFKAPRIVEYTLLQSWTIKPAVLKEED